MINYQKALTNLRYFATHCIVDAKTKKPFKWTNAQLNLLDKLQEYGKSKQIIHTNKRARLRLWI